VCLLLQIELYSHVGAIRSLVDFLRADGWSIAAVFCMDVAFVSEPSKYIAGAMQVCLRTCCLCVGLHAACVEMVPFMLV
jgi:hypothetical protein